MKIALVIPPWRPEDIFPSKTASVQINYWQPLGTLYVASALMEAGNEVRFLNGAFLGHEEIRSALKDFEPQIVGLYSTTFGWKRACAMARAIKKEIKETFIVAGGPYPIAIKGDCLKDCEAIDAVVTGEGERTMVDLAEAIKDNAELSRVKGLVYRTDGHIIENPPMPLIDDLDSLPFPARELLGRPDLYIPPPATYRRKPVAVIITSRGCNRRCIFCFQIDRYREKGIRYRSVHNVIKEIEHCLAQGYREIKFIDDTLASDYGRALELAEEIKHKKLDFTWFASACVNQVDRRLLRAFKEAGCWAILMGAESGVQKNLNTLRKGITLEQIKTAVRIAKEEGLKVFTPFLIGIPGETYEEALQTIEFACELDPDVANFHALTPFPGTELYDMANEYGHISTDLEDYTYQGAAFVPRSMTREEIIKLRQIAFRRFYSRPRFLLRRILGLRSIQDIKVAFRGIKSLFWIWVKRDVFHKTESYS
jgi:radical SAM superfamily enzyme YgiQ (UPF0313 family)